MVTGKSSSMTHTQQFIEDAIAGGWKSDLLQLPNSYYKIDKLTRKQGDTVGIWFYYTKLDLNKWPTKKSIEVLAGEVLLDPLAWQAVGKARGWDNRTTFYNRFTDGREDALSWRLDMHRFIDHLADGDDINSALGKL